MPGKEYGFIDYRTPRQAKEALDFMNGRLFMTKSLHVEYSKSNRSDTPTGPYHESRYLYPNHDNSGDTQRECHNNSEKPSRTKNKKARKKEKKGSNSNEVSFEFRQLSIWVFRGDTS